MTGTSIKNADRIENHVDSDQTKCDHMYFYDLMKK